MNDAARAWTADDIPEQEGRVIVVTGANSGLGLRASEALARKGALVVLACRNPDRGRAALDAVAALATGPAPQLLALDLADLTSVAAAADELAERFDHLDVLVNNAGVMALPLTRTADGFEAQFGTNHLGHFALTGRVLPLLLAAPEPRVVTVSSLMHRTGKMRWDDLNWRDGYHRWPAYGQSKLANLLFAFELDRLARSNGTDLLSAAAHPGYAATHLQAAGPEASGNVVMLKTMELVNKVFAQSDAMGAWPELYAATAAGIEGGRFYGPQERFGSQGHPGELRASAPAYKEDEARRLWELSEELTGVTYAW